MNDYYEILNVNRNANNQEIKKSFKKLAMKWHPDKNPDNKEEAEKKFKKVNEAYSILSDNNSKSQYDSFGKAGLNNGGGYNFSHADAQDIFSTFFGRTDPFNGFHEAPPFNTFFRCNHSCGNSRFETHRTHRVFNSGCSSFNGNENGEDKIKSGTTIIIKNLKTHMEKNGKMGKIINYHIPTNRYNVFLEESGEKIALKFGNIQQIVDIIIINLKGNKELNGKRGKIIGYDSAINRYRVVIDDKAVDIKNENIIIETEACVKIYNIEHTKKYNGMYGKIMSYDNHSNRYMIKLKGNKILKLKPENIQL